MFDGCLGQAAVKRSFVGKMASTGHAAGSAVREGQLSGNFVSRKSGCKGRNAESAAYGPHTVAQAAQGRTEGAIASGSQFEIFSPLAARSRSGSF